jgi:hypothetical protein
MEAEISIEGLFERKHADFGLLEKGELCHALLDGVIHFLPLLIIPSCQLCLRFL